MGITESQKQQAENQQWIAARDGSREQRLIAGPGTGKSRTIEKRVCNLISQGEDPRRIYVISFTRATCRELTARIERFCADAGLEGKGADVAVSTMHSLALSVLKRANLLNQYPSEPVMLDDWEQEHVYDEELSSVLGCKTSRAAEIRKAHDTEWHTLDPASIAQARITEEEVRGFNAFHSARSNLYCCVLPGEVIHRCVKNIELGNLQTDQFPPIARLIVDEFQDLNACDQRFVELLHASGGDLFIAGDDDQSIYAFRHADPSGIVRFHERYPNAVTHELTDCFRCAPRVLSPAVRLVEHNPERLRKTLVALYGSADPPVHGTLNVWSFTRMEDEARAVAESCKALIDAGMAGRENRLVILLSQVNPTSIQIDPIIRELGNLGLPFSVPAGKALTENEGLRAVYYILRVLRDLQQGKPDYPPYRGLLYLLHGVGRSIAKRIADDCINRGENFRRMFVDPPPPTWLGNREARAVTRVASIVSVVTHWKLEDTIANRLNDIGQLLTEKVFVGATQSAEHLASWLGLASQLPQAMQLAELLELLSPHTYDQQEVLNEVYARLGETPDLPVAPKKIRILTMHGAKGLSGDIVFIPGAVQGICPKAKSLQAAGLLIEQRRLFYVSITRAMAACIISHANTYTGAAAFALGQKPVLRLGRSQFLNEMDLRSVNRDSGLNPDEARAIMDDVRSL
jgi:DNA helicase II / ATP-dependent DNA helicase PcrA